ncbi:MAG: hypothetical protein AB1782_06445 [Cyanobacteriota bacterium]
MSEKDKNNKDNGIILNIESKVIGYLGKKVIDDIESSLEGFIPGKEKKESTKDQNNENKDKSVLSGIDDKLTDFLGQNAVSDIESTLNKLDPTAEKKIDLQKTDNNEKDYDNKENKDNSIVSDIDDKITKFFGKKTINDLESSLDSLIPVEDSEHDSIGNLDSKLDDFLSGKINFGIDDEEHKNHDIKTEVKNNEQKTITQPELNSKQITQRSPEQTAEDIQKLKIEKELQAIKERIKPSPKKVEMTEKTSTMQVKSDSEVEKKFIDRELDDALTALKSKYKDKNQKNKQADNKDIDTESVTDKEMDTSLQEFLKKMDKN